MTQQKQGVREMRLVFETTPGNFSRTDTHIMDRISAALAGVNNANLAFAFFDEGGRRLRKVELGENYSESMVKKVDFELTPAEEDIGA